MFAIQLTHRVPTHTYTDGAATIATSAAVHDADRHDLQGLPSDAPVLIAGGGPSGLFLALDLAAQGVPSIIIEPRTEDRPDSAPRQDH